MLENSPDHPGEHERLEDPAIRPFLSRYGWIMTRLRCHRGANHHWA
jgi:hypothetical protein